MHRRSESLSSYRRLRSIGLYQFKILSQTLETEPSIAPHCSPRARHLQQQGPVLSGESEKPRGTQVTIAGHRENQGVCLSSRKIEGTRTFRPHWQLQLIKWIIAHLSFGNFDPNSPYGIQPPCPHTASIRSTGPTVGLHLSHTLGACDFEKTTTNKQKKSRRHRLTKTAEEQTGNPKPPEIRMIDMQTSS